LSAGGVSLFAGDGGPPTTIATKGSFFEDFSEAARINDAGMVAFHSPLTAGGQGVFRGNGTTTTTIADTNGSIFGGFDRYVDLNNAGTVVFLAFPKAGGQVIETGTGGALTLVADTNGPFLFLGDPAINNHGEVAFSAGLTKGGVGLFTGPDPVADKVLLVGDPLFGSTVIAFYYLRGLNDSGQIAFGVALANGAGDIVRADPIRATETPEPGTLGLLLLGLVVLAGVWSSQRLGRRYSCPTT
jgi:hypothetical protein